MPEVQNKINKMNKNSIRLIKLLLEGFFSKEEIEELLKIKEPTFYKYLKCFKEAGFKVKRKDDRYFILSFFEKLDFKKFETTTIAYLFNIIKTKLPLSLKNEAFSLLDKISHLSTIQKYDEIKEKLNYLNSIEDIENKTKEKIIKQLEKYMLDNSTVEVISKNKKKMILKPLNFEYGIKKIYVNFLDTNNQELKRLSIAQIIKITPKVSIYHSLDEKRETIFELYGKLASTYILKEEERIIEKTKEKLVIANSSSDKNILFQRLLRYDILCKVILPLCDVNAFKKLVDESINNIGN